MPGCSAVGCSNSTAKGKTMKVFPRDPERRKIWAARTKRNNWTPTNSSYLCEDHFDQTQWENRRVDGKKKLKWNAEPTVFAFRQPVKKRRMLSYKSVEGNEAPANITRLYSEHSYVSSYEESKLEDATCFVECCLADVSSPSQNDSHTTEKLTPHQNDPHTAENLTPHQNDPHTAENVTSSQNDPNTAEILTPSQKDPHTAEQLTPHQNDPHTTKKLTHSQNDPHTAEKLMPSPNEPHTAEKLTPHKKDPHTTKKLTPHQNDPHTAEKLRPSPNDPHMAEKLTPSHNDSHLAKTKTENEDANAIRIQKMVKFMNKQQSVICRLQTKIRELKTAQKKSNYSPGVLHKFLNANQIGALSVKSTRGFTWSDETIKAALKLWFSCGTRGYEELLSTNYPIPSLRTLRRKLQDMPMHSGIHGSAFVILNEKMHVLKAEQKECDLLLDEIATTPGMNYDAASQSLI